MRPEFSHVTSTPRRFEAVPCPALDPGSGRCELYAARPITCRTFGTPVRFASDTPPPCRLCFTGASEAEIDACRVEIDPDGLENALLAELGAADDTAVAFALAGEQ